MAVLTACAELRGAAVRIAAIGVLFVFSSIFWGAFEQAASSLNLFADRLTNNQVFGHSFPSTWYQSLNSMFMIFGLAPRATSSFSN